MRKDILEKLPFLILRVFQRFAPDAAALQEGA